jgi:hypothetical protein
MFIHGKRINDRLYVKTVGGNWIPLRTIAGTGEKESQTPVISSYVPSLFLLNGGETDAFRNSMHEHT